MTHHASTIPMPGPPKVAHSAAGGAHYTGASITTAGTRRTELGEASRAPQPGKDGQTSRERIMNDLRELYCCRPTKAIFERTWHPEAMYEDPLIKCHGRSEYEAMWHVMPKLFSKSETISSRVLTSTRVPNRIICSQTQEYTLRLIGRKQRIESMITLDLDETDRIIQMEDKWYGKELPTRYGALLARRLHGQVAPWVTKVPKED
ncbi:hypothetical protein F5I97DRAFT_1924298 [Phlebopus sp. FC_14]|nr:hypothetical protein F5I97DRAFT_1924298 [Phlebopus sp. FC_14]